MVDLVDRPETERIVAAAADKLELVGNELQRVHRALVRVLQLVAETSFLAVTEEVMMHLDVPNADVARGASRDHDGGLLHVGEEGDRRYGGRLAELHYALRWTGRANRYLVVLEIEDVDRAVLQADRHDVHGGRLLDEGDSAGVSLEVHDQRARADVPQLQLSARATDQHFVEIGIWMEDEGRQEVRAKVDGADALFVDPVPHAQVTIA